jgi:hypothetical protein
VYIHTTRPFELYLCAIRMGRLTGVIRPPRSPEPVRPHHPPRTRPIANPAAADVGSRRPHARAPRRRAPIPKFWHVQARAPQSAGKVRSGCVLAALPPGNPAAARGPSD